MLVRHCNVVVTRDTVDTAPIYGLKRTVDMMRVLLWMLSDVNNRTKVMHDAGYVRHWSHQHPLAPVRCRQ
jgi:hypothetical protein